MLNLHSKYKFVVAIVVVMLLWACTVHETSKVIQTPSERLEAPRAPTPPQQEPDPLPIEDNRAPYDIPPKPVPTPEEETVEDVQARIVVRICEQYRPIVEQMYEYFPIDPDLILAIMAQESACDKWATDGVSIGLMQITPKSWTLREDILWNPKWNIWQGMWMLQANIDNEEHNPDHNVARALAAYNCGWTSLEANECLYFGGWQYAAEVINFWLPHFRAESR